MVRIYITFNSFLQIISREEFILFLLISFILAL